MAGLHVPLLTLRNPPCGWPRIARGRSGSLLLDRTTLAFATPRRLTRRYSPSLSPSIGAARPAAGNGRHAAAHYAFDAQCELVGGRRRASSEGMVPESGRGSQSAGA